MWAGLGKAERRLEACGEGGEEKAGERQLPPRGEHLMVSGARRVMAPELLGTLLESVAASAPIQFGRHDIKFVSTRGYRRLLGTPVIAVTARCAHTHTYTLAHRIVSYSAVRGLC
ncbi:hypothetical protein ElyMa_006933900 [Elysia marginata]|uniref:Uncharacterized protein n=1 Tax=Elysia marginata TaxID=1093978 RepID=A0AAV4JLE3_9GAST|nr:hypothetical protein ElyMa_006933900 [Elysia marginata]